MNPEITVIIPCYNQAHYLKDAVASVVSQTYQDWECIIVNDGSKDDTEKIALQLAEKDARIKYFKKENGGLSSARNKGLDEASGDFIQFLDADDSIAPGKFAASLNSGNKADVIISDFTFFNKEGSNVPTPYKLKEVDFSFDTILTGWDDKFVIPIHCGIFKSHLFSDLRFNETLKAREDWLMWLQIYLKNVQTVSIDEPLALYRSSPGSMSQNKLLMDQSLIAVYRIVYPLLTDDHKEIFFKKVMDSFENRLAVYAHLLHITRRSKSYRLGNFFIKNLNRFKKPEN